MPLSRSRPACLVILGLPRSGTTLLTTLLDRHSRIHLYYEPWNASPNERPAVSSTLDGFRAQMRRRFGGPPLAAGTITGFKETTTHAGTTRWALDSARALARENPTEVIWIQREPLHCLLSKLEGARRWWGHDDARLDEATLSGFLRETRDAYRELAALVREGSGTVVPYETLARAPAKTLAALMERLQLDLEPAQLSYHEGPIDRGRVMGDPSLIESPRPVGDAAIEKREAEVSAHRSLIDTALAQPQNAAAWKAIEVHRAGGPGLVHFDP